VYGRTCFLPPAGLVGTLFLVPVAFGQASYTSQVRGIVTDQTGAVVQNALVTITNDGTAISTADRTRTIAGCIPSPDCDQIPTR